MRRGVIIYGLFVAVLFAPFLFWGHVFVPGDFLPFIYPWRGYEQLFPHNVELFDVAVFFYPQDVFYNQSLKSGVLPLWNPFLFSGHPAIASGQSGFLYPPRLLLHSAFEPGVAKTWLQLLHLFGMGCGMHWFLRIKGFGSFACSVGALAWMGNTYVTSWLEFEHAAIAGMFLPLLLVSFEKALAGDRRWWFVLPVLGALSLHSGHLQINLYTGGIFIVYSLIRLIQGRKLSTFGFLGLVGLLTAGLAAPTVLPFLEFLQQSQRVPLDPVANATDFWSLLLSLFNPDIFGNPSKGFLINRCQANLIYPEFACFVGIVPLIFALAARGKEALGFRLVSIVCLLVASATFGMSLPFLDRFVPGRILFVLVFCLAYSAAIGAQQFESNSGRVRKLAIGVGVFWSIILATIAYLLFHPQLVIDWWQQNPSLMKLPPINEGGQEVAAAFRRNYAWNAQLWLPIFACGFLVFLPKNKNLLLAVTALELVLFASGFNTSVAQERLLATTPEIQAMQGTKNRVVSIACANYNTLTPYGLRLVNGYESLVSSRYATALRQTSPGEALPMRSLSFNRLDLPVVDALSVEYALFPPHLGTTASGWDLVFEGAGGKVYQNQEAVPRAFLVGQVRPLKNLLEMETLRPKVEAFVSVPPPAELRNGLGHVAWKGETPNSVFLHVETETTQLLVLTDSYDEGWKCLLDGVEVQVFPVNLASRGVYVPAGAHRLEFHYKPDSLKYGVMFCWIALLVNLLLFSWTFYRSQREGTQAVPAESSSP